MYVFIGFIFLSVGLFTGATTSKCLGSVADLCKAKIPEMPYLQSRDPEYVMTSELLHWSYCDVYTINTSQWYRSEMQMSTSCPKMYMCGTKFPIWMSGSNPTPSEGAVNRTCCLRDFDSCCLVTYKVTAVNCKEYMAYCFIDFPSSCPQRYCFDNPEGRSSMKYTSSTTAISLQGSSGSSTRARDLTANTESSESSSNTTVPEAFDANNKLLIIVIPVIGVMAAVICGLVFIIIWRSRRPKITNETDVTNEANSYETLQPPDPGTMTENEDKNEYRMISFEKAGPQAPVDRKLEEFKNVSQDDNSFYYNTDNQLMNCEREPFQDEHYVTVK